MKSGRTLKKRSKPRHKRVTKHVRVRKSAATAAPATARRTRRMRKSGGVGSGTRRRFWPFGKKKQQVAPLETTSVVTTSPNKSNSMFFNWFTKGNTSKVTPVVTGVPSPRSNLAAATQSASEVVSSVSPVAALVSPAAARVSPAAARVLSNNQTPSTKITHDIINEIIEKSDLSIPEQYNKIKSLIEKLDDSIYNEEYKKGFIDHIEKIKAQQQKNFDNYLFDLMLNVNTNLIEIKQKNEQKNEQAFFIPSTKLTNFKKEFYDYKKFIELNNERITNTELKELNDDTIDSITIFLTKNKQVEDANKFAQSLPSVPLPKASNTVPLVDYNLENIYAILLKFIAYVILVLDVKINIQIKIGKGNYYLHGKNNFMDGLLKTFNNAITEPNEQSKISYYLDIIRALLTYLNNTSFNSEKYVNNVYQALSDELTNRVRSIPYLYLKSTKDKEKKNDLVRVLTTMKTFLEEI